MMPLTGCAEVEEGESASWNLNLPYSGKWRIYEWHDVDGTRCSNVPLRINHDGGSTDMTVNQQINSGNWNYIGIYDFSEGSGSVELTNDCSGGDVVADAVKAVYVDIGTRHSVIMTY